MDECLRQTHRGADPTCVSLTILNWEGFGRQLRLRLADKGFRGKVEACAAHPLEVTRGLSARLGHPFLIGGYRGAVRHGPDISCRAWPARKSRSAAVGASEAALS